MKQLNINKNELCDTLRSLKEREGFDLFIDLCGVDHLGKKDERFEVVYHLANTKNGEHVRVKVSLSEASPSIPTVTDIFKGANWFERECFDLFGINFEGHPNLKRLLLYDGFEGHPLRKDYPINKRQGIPVPSELKDDDGGFWMNLGPAHPATHRTFRIMLKLEGEKIIKAVPEIGYLHRCFEKEAEDHPYAQIVPYTDRLNYCSALMNNVGYCKAVEELMGIEIPERAKYIRVLICELSRIMDHLIAIGTNVVDMGALTNFWYTFNVRELIYDWVEKLCGARLTNSYARIGGVERDIPADTARYIPKVLSKLDDAIKDVTSLLKKNRIFLDRTIGIGAIKANDALNLGWTGPALRAAGVAYDIRKDRPYYHYDELDWDVPVGDTGDTYDRIMVRFEEMRQSTRIIEQVLKIMPHGPVITDRHDVALPPKANVYGSIEGMMDHFKLIMNGIAPNEGEIYSFTEAANGELGFYIVSDGGPKPYRIKVRPPCFAIYQGFPHIIKGHMIADAVAVLGSLNVIAGELDR